MPNYEWQTTVEGAAKLDTETVDRIFGETVNSPEMRSSGWICTLTIECGTVVCACR